MNGQNIKAIFFGVVKTLRLGDGVCVPGQNDWTPAFIFLFSIFGESILKFFPFIFLFVYLFFLFCLLLLLFFSFDWFVKQGFVVLEISYKDFQVKTMKAQNGLAVLSEKELPKDGSLFVARQKAWLYLGVSFINSWPKLVIGRGFWELDFLPLP